MMIHHRSAGAAQTLGLQALGWLAEDEDRLGALMAAAGLAPDALRARASDAEFLGFVLDFLMDDENRAVDFARAHGLGEHDLRQARAALPGGDAPDWT